MLITTKGRNEQEKQQMIHGKMQKPTQNQWKKVLGKKLILALQLRLLLCSRICSAEVDYGVKKVKSCGI